MTTERTRLRDFFKEDQIAKLFESLNNFEIEISSKQMDWSDDIMYRHHLHGMAAYCNANEKDFLEKLMAKAALEDDPSRI